MGTLSRSKVLLLTEAGPAGDPKGRIMKKQKQNLKLWRLNMRGPFLQNACTSPEGIPSSRKAHSRITQATPYMNFPKSLMKFSNPWGFPNPKGEA